MHDKLKVNLHLTERCNASCRHCFGHFHGGCELDVSGWLRVLGNLARSGRVEGVNFAGGEPLLYRGLPELITAARRLGLKVSIITNGLLLLRHPVLGMLGELDTLGFSVDSFDASVSRELGRCTKSSHRVFGLGELRGLLPRLRKHRDLRIKVNTVVSTLNCREIMYRDLLELGVDRWKVIRMTPFADGQFSNHEILPSDVEFEDFVRRNPFPGLTREDSMTNTYLVVGPHGRLLDNRQIGEGRGNPYGELGDLTCEDFDTVFARYEGIFDYRSYMSRYTHTPRQKTLAAVARAGAQALKDFFLPIACLRT